VDELHERLQRHVACIPKLWKRCVSWSGSFVENTTKITRILARLR
jgi:hypothetical protein